jgi:hypothetical protein
MSDDARTSQGSYKCELFKPHIDELAQFVKHPESWKVLLVAACTVTLQFRYRYFPHSEQIMYMQKIICVCKPCRYRSQSNYSCKHSIIISHYYHYYYYTEHTHLLTTMQHCTAVQYMSECKHVLRQGKSDETGTAYIRNNYRDKHILLWQGDYITEWRQLQNKILSLPSDNFISLHEGKPAIKQISAMLSAIQVSCHHHSLISHFIFILTFHLLCRTLWWIMTTLSTAAEHHHNHKLKALLLTTESWRPF